MLAPLASVLPAASALASLAAYLAVIAAAAFAGGSSVAFLSLGHRRMQVVITLTAGVMLGVGLLHLLPHAHLELAGPIETTTAWVLAGFFLMFLLERAFHGHAHHAADGSHAGHGCEQDPGHAVGDTHKPARWAWCGAFAGLALHSLVDGAALAASVGADGDHGAGLLAGFATFLAIVLHKPLDAGIIATLMINSGASAGTRGIVNAAYALVVPLGAVAFLASLRLFGDDQSHVLGAAMAMAAGAFLCIAAADLLPEVEFHSHDRLLLTASLAVGLSIAWAIAVAERSSHAHQAHAHHPHGAAGQNQGGRDQID